MVQVRQLTAADVATAGLHVPTEKFDTLSRLVEQHGISAVTEFKFLGSGCSRAAFDIGNDLVVKIDLDNKPTSHFGIHGQSKQEWEMWHSATPEQREFLCPIVAHDEVEHRWTVMRKADQSKVYDLGWDGIQEYIRKVGATGLATWDVKERNIGYVGNKLVLVDYGVK